MRKMATLSTTAGFTQGCLIPWAAATRQFSSSWHSKEIRPVAVVMTTLQINNFLVVVVNAFLAYLLNQNHRVTTMKMISATHVIP